MEARAWNSILLRARCGNACSAVETVPDMHCRDLDRLRRFISACFVVMRTNLTWAELGGLVPSAEAAKKRFRRWATRGVFDRLMDCSQPVAAPDVLHIDSTKQPFLGCHTDGAPCVPC